MLLTSNYCGVSELHLSEFTCQYKIGNWYFVHFFLGFSVDEVLLSAGGPFSFVFSATKAFTVHAIKSFIVQCLCVQCIGRKRLFLLPEIVHQKTFPRKDQQATSAKLTL